MLEGRGTAKLRLLFGIVISTMLACLPCRAQQSAGSLAPGIRIGAVEPAPNYGKSSVEQAKQRLVDGLRARYPIWTRPGGVTWARTTPVAISIDWDENERISGTLEVHAARGDYASVSGPRRIDIYTRTPAGQFELSNSRWISDRDMLDRSTTWLDVAFSDASGGLIVVLHSGGAVLSLDEIRVRRAATDTALTRRTESVALEDIRAVRDDSAVQLRSDLQSSAACRSSVAGDSGWKVTALKPYADLDLCRIRDQNRLESITGFSFEQESVVLRIDNGGDRARLFQLSIPGTLEEERRLGRLRSVVSNDGKTVLDAIEPLADGPIELAPGDIVHFWVDLALTALRPGRGTLDLQVRELGEGTQRSVSLRTELVDVPIRSEHQLEAVAWSTLSEPIWNDPTRALEELRDGGNTVFMIPPWRVPVVVDYADTPEGREHYVQHLAEFARSGTVLVQLYALKTLGGCRGRKAGEMRGHIKRLVQWAEQAGLPYSRWAVYPTDEAHDQKLDELLVCVKTIKSADPQVRIYVNPTISRDSAGALQTLKQMAPYVDLWQPRLAILQGETLDFFREQAHFWFYDNPKQPAKSESPLFYRSLAWVALDLGATGTGFWGFDDTKKSSAWDDFDGDRPDWAVMYESPSGPISSRRWRAFRDGLEDAAAVRSAYSQLQPVLRKPACEIVLRFDPDACRVQLVRALVERPRD